MTPKILLSGNANPELTSQIAKYANIPLGNVVISRFSDGESRIEILDNIRGFDVFVVQSTSAPTNDNLMELLLLCDASRRAQANQLTAIIPYFGYARQDKLIRSARVPISAKMVADLIHTVGIKRVLTVDLHAEQIQGFFSMPIENLYGSRILLKDIVQQGYVNPIIVSPDIGGVVRARAFAEHLNEADLAIIDKRRPMPNESQVMNIIGDVKDRICIIVDDMVDTAGTLCHASMVLKEKGAQKIVAYCTHPILSGNAIHSIQSSPLDELVVTNSIPLHANAIHCKKIRQLNIASMLAEAIAL